MGPQQVARRLHALPERRMRAAKLREIVIAMDPARAAWLLDVFATAGRAGGPSFQISLLAAIDVVSNNGLPSTTSEAIAAAACSAQLHGCSELLGSSGAVPRPESDSDASREAGSDSTAGEPGQTRMLLSARRLTLGERKALARSSDRKTLDPLLADPHPDVVELLLGNPHVTERHILRIATSRKSPGEALVRVLQADRFGTRPAVRAALVRNPNFPLETAIRLLGLLNAAEQRALACDPALRNPLRLALRRRLSSKR